MSTLFSDMWVNRGPKKSQSYSKIQCYLTGETDAKFPVSPDNIICLYFFKLPCIHRNFEELSLGLSWLKLLWYV